MSDLARTTETTPMEDAMRYKLTFALGLAAGYVLGAKAGTERYEQISNAYRRLMDTPAAQEAAGVVGAQTGRAVNEAKRWATEKLSDTLGTAPGSPDRQSAGTAGGGAPYPGGRGSGLGAR